MKTVLVVDDEPNFRLILSELLSDEGYEVFTADSGETAMDVIRETDLDLIITDMRMPGMGGMELLAEVKIFNHDLPVIMITAFGEVEKAVAAMQAGAFNYLTKPFNNDELLVSVSKAIEHYAVVRENLRLRSEMSGRNSFANMVGRTSKMQHIYSLIEKVAPTTASVLITGESGTGKELVARAIHFHSPRRESPLISLNCAGLPEHLLESELFGHEKGAFTGAVTLRKGRFEIADTGTIFLDEIGEMPLNLQAKLLRVIQERTFERLGNSKPMKVDVRIIAATNKDLKEEVGKGTFREDLYYRLNVLNLHIPPLRERPDDIPLLVNHFIERFARRLNRPELGISSEALRYLSRFPWEGNVRELENTMERAAILCENDRIEIVDVQPEAEPLDLFGNNSKISVDTIPAGVRLPEYLDLIEKKLIESALIEAGSIQAHAAERLGITKSLLQYKMKKYEINSMR
ncbi:MAG: sigma-54 dependent transcriptional regulator [Proteobacteria bacterium]|nr:sigma-54 dependent transcriptional regulator [Pseudomonadota bacterium]MBU1738527.1 sigma-54 dependent transcriptional regulator [Pseudomonadota bacterium]